MTPIIAIDPGISGGFACRDDAGHIWIENMPDSMTSIVDRLQELYRELSATVIPIVYLEKAGTHRKGNNASASCKFARHCGWLEATLYATGFSVIQVAPGIWQRMFGNLPKEYMPKKRAIREEVKRRYPKLKDKVTLKTADALGLLTYAMR